MDIQRKYKNKLSFCIRQKYGVTKVERDVKLLIPIYDIQYIAKFGIITKKKTKELSLISILCYGNSKEKKKKRKFFFVRGSTT